MTNTNVVCLLLTFFCFSHLSYARQVPEECAKGPSVWCENLKRGADCGAVGHCIATVWETHESPIRANDVSAKIVRIFRQLKDVKEFVNADYLETKIGSVCRSMSTPELANHCKENTNKLGNYIDHVLKSETSAETMCTIMEMCNSPKLDNILAMNKKKTEPKKHKETKLLGSSQCTWGPSYWCSNISTSHECKATHHCVSRVWSKTEYPQDNDSICKICTDMVKQARDQLQSNETQEELKEVFEGSCNLIPIKLVRKECIKLADDFVPELVETLASQMNPQAVCSVAGLCNNAHIDTMLEEYHAQLELRAGCTNCSRTVRFMRKKFDATSYDDLLVGLLKICQKLSSLSDSCSMLVFKYYENIQEALKTELNQGLCHVSGQCAYKYHSHDEFVFPEENADHTVEDDVPCELCEQLVKHLRDVLVANTTELEFYKVLKGLCKQTGNFKDECLHLAEEYYPLIYKYLVDDLKADKICAMIGVCGNTTEDVPIFPLVQKEIKIVTKPLIGNDEANSYKIEKSKTVESSTTAAPAPLPVERMFVRLPQNKASCSFCQYFLHYLQVELSDNNVESKITDVVDKACDKLPETVSDECKTFVSQYGPAVIALLVQEIDPASVCPALGLCPKTEEIRKVDATAGKSNCPLCLFAVEQLEAMLKNNHSEENIRKDLDILCNHLSTKLRTSCINFVDTYTNQLVEMLVANMNAQEICVFLKLCTDNVRTPLQLTNSDIDKYHDKPQLRGDRNNFRRKPMLPAEKLEGGHIETNEIGDNTVNGRPVLPEVSKTNTVCVMCEFVMKEIDAQIKDKRNQDDIINLVDGICKHMPKSVQSECDDFVKQYGDFIVHLLLQNLDPEKVCQELHLCKVNGMSAVKAEEILDCAVCETVVMAVKKVLNNDKVDRNIVHIVEKSCGLLPAKYYNRCHTMMEIYGTSIIHLIEDFGAKGVCQKIGLCSHSNAAYVQMYREKRN